MVRRRDLVLRFGWNAVSCQILNPGMRLWFSSAGDAVAGYASFGGVWTVAGAPVCQPDRLPNVADELVSGVVKELSRVISRTR